MTNSAAGIERRSARGGLPQTTPRTAIIDIGSNSIRLVIYSGPRRNPAIIFNEKVSAGLGKGLAANGNLDAQAMARTGVALRRFHRLLDHVGVDDVLVVATAAVRDAANGPAFVAEIAAIGFSIDVLSGEQEAVAAAQGVLAGIPGADGIVGDLGGGSLELVKVKGNAVGEGQSTPFGVLRMNIDDRAAALRKQLGDFLGKPQWLKHGEGREFYMVGGSWRALALLDMELTKHPLRVLHQYHLDPARLPLLIDTIRTSTREQLRAVRDLSQTRIDALVPAAELALAVCNLIKPARCVISAYGLREGLLFARLDEATQARDPLIVSAQAYGKMQSRYRQDGRALFGWLQRLWPALPAQHARLLLAACHLADVGWQATPDFRADRAVDIALHGSWVGIDAQGRAMLAHTLACSFGGETRPRREIRPLMNSEQITLATGWGLAMRLGKRLAAGRDDFYEISSLYEEELAIVLALRDADMALAGESVDRRLRRLAAHLGKKPEVRRIALEI